jgi:hypothetical protein
MWPADFSERLPASNTTASNWASVVALRDRGHPRKHKLLGTNSDEQIARELSRPRHQVQKRRKQLGILPFIYTSRHWTIEEEQLGGTMPDYRFAKRLRRTLVQVVIALVVTPEGFPLAYEVMAGNTADKTTLRDFLKKIEELYGKAERVWVMDRGIPTEEVLAEMRASDPPVHYLVGTPKWRLSHYEKQLLEQPWQAVREGVQVKLLSQEGELYVLAESKDRVNKERAMRRRQLKGLVKRIKDLAKTELSRDQLLLRLGAAKSQYPAAWRLVAIQIQRFFNWFLEVVLKH